MTATCVQHTTNPTTVDVCESFFLPTDARHWIPSGTADVTLTVDAIELEEDFFATAEFAAEQWCEATHGKGSFWGCIWED